MNQQRLKAVAAVQELVNRRKAKEPIFDATFPEQSDFIQDGSRFLVAKCTRRAGKSVGLGKKFFNAARKYPGSLSPYIGLTRESCKNIMWPVLKEIDAKYKIGANFTESNLEVTLPNHAKIKLFGADQKGFIEKLRGPKYPFAGVDEAQAFKSHLSSLVDDVLTPATGDYEDGQIALTGTPGPVPKGYFHECSLGKHGFSVHEWTVYDNPYFPNPREFVAELFKKKGWTKDNPTYRREWLGEWVADRDALVYKFTERLNICKRLPDEDFTYVIGVDLGYSPDPSAFIVCAYSEYDRNLYIIDTYTALGLTVAGVSERIKYYLGKYPSAQVIADLGGQGKMIGASIAEDLTKRYGDRIHAAKKTDKAGFIEIMNSDLQEGLIKVYEPVSAPLVEEWMNLIWDSEKVARVEDGRYPNHLADAALYAWRHCYNYAQSPRPTKTVRGSEKEMDEYWEKEAEKVRRKQRDPDDGLFG